VFETLSLASVPFIYKYYVGSWSYAWLLVVPIIAFVFPLLLFYVVMAIFSFRSKFEFPKQLLPPRWYRLGSGFHYPPYREREKREKQKLIAEIDSLKNQLRD